MDNPRKADPQWRNLIAQISSSIGQGMCTRRISYDDFPYKNTIPVPEYMFPKGQKFRNVGVDKKYIRVEILDKVDTIVYTLGHDMYVKKPQVTAFALLVWKGVDVEILVACASDKKNLKGSARPIIEKALKLARDRKMKTAELHALRHVMGYYPRFGFHRVGSLKNGNDIDGWLMKKNLTNMVNWHPSSSTSKPSLPTAAKPKAPMLPKRRNYSSFPVDSIVWVKQNSYPWWPAQVKAPSVVQQRLRHAHGDVFVAFYADTSSYAWVHPKYVHLYTRHPDHRKHVTVGGKNAHLKRSIEKANVAYELLYRHTI